MATTAETRHRSSLSGPALCIAILYTRDGTYESASTGHGRSGLCVNDRRRDSLVSSSVCVDQSLYFPCLRKF